MTGPLSEIISTEPTEKRLTLVDNTLAKKLGNFGDLGGGYRGDDLASLEDILGNLAGICTSAAH